jgi:hypothetical protein
MQVKLQAKAGGKMTGAGVHTYIDPAADDKHKDLA